MIVSPYGSVDATVIDPDEFAFIATGLRDAYSTGDRSQLAEVQASCRRIIDRYPNDEPDGAGFFAFGAVVSIYYATETLINDSLAGVVNAAKRFLDVLGAADDDGCAGLFAAAQGYLSRAKRKLGQVHSARLSRVTQPDFGHFPTNG